MGTGAPWIRKPPLSEQSENQSVSWAKRLARLFKMRLVLFKCHISCRVESTMPRGQSQRGVTRQEALPRSRQKKGQSLS